MKFLEAILQAVNTEGADCTSVQKRPEKPQTIEAAKVYILVGQKPKNTSPRLFLQKIEALRNLENPTGLAVHYSRALP